MPKTAILADGVAEWLDQTLTLNREGYLLPLEGNEQELRDLTEREREMAERFARLKDPSPALLLAQLCYACFDQGEDIFDSARASRYDFAAVAANGDTLERRLIARVMCGLEKLAGGPVAEVIARHRELARRDEAFQKACHDALAPFEAAADAAEGKRAAELRAAAENMRAVMMENRRLAEQLAAVQASAAPMMMAAE